MNLRCKKRLHKSHFTLTELLVVIAIFAILLALLQPSLLSALRTARMMACQNNLKSQGSAVAAYTEDYDYWLPVNQFPLISPPTGSSSPYIWRWQMAPYLGLSQEYAPLIGQWYESNPNPKWNQSLIEGVFSCPEWDITPLSSAEQSKMGMGGYGYNQRVSTGIVNPFLSARRIDKITYADETILIGDSFRYNFPTAGEQALFLELRRPSSIYGIARDRHKTGLNSLWVDLHVSWNDYFFISSGKPTTLREDHTSNAVIPTIDYYYYTKKRP